MPAAAAERTEFAIAMTSFDQMSVRAYGMVNKWTFDRPIRVKVLSEFRETETKALDYTLATIEANTKLSFKRDDNDDKPDLTIEFAPDRIFMGANEFGGVTRGSWGRIGGDLRKTTVQMRRSGNSYLAYHLVPHEMMHAMGFHDHAQGFDSISSYYSTRNSYSDWDQIFMRVLYDPRLKAGTPRGFALPIMCRLLHERLIAEKVDFVPDLNRSGPHPHCERLAARPIEAKTSFDRLRIGWAYLDGRGVAKNLAEAEKWARLAADGPDPDKDVKYLLAALEKSKGLEQVGAPPDEATMASWPNKVEFRAPTVGTTFVLAGNGGLFKIDRVDGTTVQTLNAKDAKARWAALFFTRGGGSVVDPAETTGAVSIWPLEVGKQVEFTHGRGAWKNVVTVLRPETIVAGGSKVLTYVVERRVTKVGDTDTPPYEGVYLYWYAPDWGFPAKYQSKFSGTTDERPVGWIVSQVKQP